MGMLDGLYNQTGQVYRQSETVDSMGGVTKNMAAYGDAFPCRIRAMSARERNMSGSTGVDVTHRLYCAASVTIAEADEVRIGTTVYHVEFVNNPHGAGHHLEVDLRERRPGRDES